MTPKFLQQLPQNKWKITQIFVDNNSLPFSKRQSIKQLVISFMYFQETSNWFLLNFCWYCHFNCQLKQQLHWELLILLLILKIIPKNLFLHQVPSANNIWQQIYQLGSHGPSSFHPACTQASKNSMTYYLCYFIQSAKIQFNYPQTNKRQSKKSA